MSTMALDPTRIQELLAGSRSRGDYDAVLAEFLNSGQTGVEVSLTEGTFAGRRAKQVKIGFDNARKKTNDTGLVHTGGKEVQVVAQSDDDNRENEHVYLINRALVGGGSNAAAAEGEDAQAA